MYDGKVDVFAFAIVFWCMLENNLPYEGLNMYQIMEYVGRDGRRPEISRKLAAEPRLVSLLNRCWHVTPELRPSFDRIVVALEELRSSEAQVSMGGIGKNASGGGGQQEKPPGKADSLLTSKPDSLRMDKGNLETKDSGKGSKKLSEVSEVNVCKLYVHAVSVCVVSMSVWCGVFLSTHFIIRYLTCGGSLSYLFVGFLATGSRRG